MSDPKKDKILDHNYDGIQEMDNPLPSWWTLLFYATIIFAAIYYYVYEFGGAKSLEEEFQSDMEKIEEIQSASKSDIDNQSKVVESIPLIENVSSDQLEIGKNAFIGKCAACHGQLGEGSIGPNLTDKYWIHGGSFSDIIHTIKVGVPTKGMIPWEALLSHDELIGVAAYIINLQGTNPVNAKEPQGDLFES